MAYKDWLPGKREEQLQMATDWFVVLKTKGKLIWKIDEELIASFEDAMNYAKEELSRPQQLRTSVTNARLKVVFDKLTSMMRDMKRRYFFVPPLTEEDVIALGLKPKDNIATPVGEPTGHAAIEIRRSGMMQLKLNIKHIGTSGGDLRADYGVRIYYSIMPLAQTEDEKSPSGIRYLKKAPTSGDDLIDSVFTRRKRELFNFHPDDKGNTVFFCARYENGKGKKGPWGPISSEMIG